MPITRHDFDSENSVRSVSEIVNKIKDGDTDLNPPYQRDSVWSKDQKVKLIHSLLHKINIPNITINDRWAATHSMDLRHLEAVIDGKQRLEAILDFLENRLEVPAQWFKLEYLNDPSAQTTTFDGLTKVAQRDIMRRPLGVSYTRFTTLEQEAEHYLIYNEAGTAHTEADLAKARSILNHTS